MQTFVVRESGAPLADFNPSVQSYVEMGVEPETHILWHGSADCEKALRPRGGGAGRGRGGGRGRGRGRVGPAGGAPAGEGDVPMLEDGDSSDSSSSSSSSSSSDRSDASADSESTMDVVDRILERFADEHGPLAAAGADLDRGDDALDLLEEALGGGPAAADGVAREVDDQRSDPGDPGASSSAVQP